jgi:hypothetical protein
MPVAVDPVEEVCCTAVGDRDISRVRKTTSQCPLGHCEPPLAVQLAAVFQLPEMGSRIHWALIAYNVEQTISFGEGEERWRKISFDTRLLNDTLAMRQVR